MIIEKIELENFMCYAGKNSMEFAEGINVIIGDNGYGKSKLYDAFYWLMYNQVFIIEKNEFRNTKSVQLEIISDKAKANVKDGKISTSVRVTFHNLNRGNSYILERKYTAIFKDEKPVGNNDSEFIVMKKHHSSSSTIMVNDEDEKRSIVAIILPPQIKDYLWFQGEQLESIIDFKKQDTLTKAINVLSNITRYDQIKSIAAAAAKKGNKEYDKELTRLSKDKDESKRLEIQKMQLSNSIQELRDDETETNENLSRAEERCEELLSKLSDATEVSKLQESKKRISDRLKELNKTLDDEQTSFHRKMFRNKWVLKGTESLHEEFSDSYLNFENKKLEEAAKRKATLKAEDEVTKKLQTRLPMDVPEPIYVQRMLNEQKCLVCDRKAEKDSDAWNKIKELIDRPKKEPKTKGSELISKQNFTEDFKKLYQNSLALTHRIKEIDSDINYTLNKISETKTKIKCVEMEMKKVDDEIQKLLSDTSQTEKSAKSIIAEYSIKNNSAKGYRDKLNQLTQQLDYKKKKLEKVKDQMKELVTGEIPKWLVEKKDTLNDFEKIASSTRERVYNKLIAQLEKEANNHYRAMTSGNRSARGQIKLELLSNGNYMPKIIDNNGVPLANSNKSNFILLKLSAIMAIISAKNNYGFASIYTLITDAPTSVFGEDYTIGFCKTISKVYGQSIIMSKEFYKNKNLRKELMTNTEIMLGKVYMITPSIPEAERENRNNLSINIKELTQWNF